jgi:dGTPase
MRSKLAGMEMAATYQQDVALERLICDFIASMTDRYILNLYNDIFVPTPLV